MSNKTDGKKALEAGDFTAAEEKLLKALKFHPDDSELWWAMMLCKSGLRSDAELCERVKADFARAASAGENPPETPFGTSYCKNALRYETGGKKRGFIKKLYDDLSDMWFSVRGKKLHAPVPREKKLPDVEKILTGIAYGAIALIAVGVWLVCYALIVWKVWALWTGFAIIVASALTAFILMRVLKKYGVESERPTTALFTVIVLSALALLTVGIIRRYRLIIIMASVVIAIAAAIGLYKLFSSKSAAKKNSGAGIKSTRDPHELYKSAQKNKNVKSSDSLSEKAENNDFQDDFD